MRPIQLLRKLSQAGLHLMPQDADAGAAGTRLKDADVEAALAQDMSLLISSCGCSFDSCAFNRHAPANAPDSCPSRLRSVRLLARGPAHRLRKLRPACAHRSAPSRYAMTYVTWPDGEQRCLVRPPAAARTRAAVARPEGNLH